MTLFMHRLKEEHTNRNNSFKNKIAHDFITNFCINLRAVSVNRGTNSRYLRYIKHLLSRRTKKFLNDSVNIRICKNKNIHIHFYSFFPRLYSGESVRLFMLKHKS